jgi:hypothetical protein
LHNTVNLENLIRVEQVVVVPAKQAALESKVSVVTE